jgi:hypothetical protein
LNRNRLVEIEVGPFLRATFPTCVILQGKWHRSAGKPSRKLDFIFAAENEV